MTGGTEVSNGDFFFYFSNATNMISSTTDFLSKCTTSIEQTQIGLASYIALFPKLEDYLLAFLMNITGNIMLMYNTF